MTEKKIERILRSDLRLVITAITLASLNFCCAALECESLPSTPNGEPDGCGSEPFSIGDTCDLQCKDGFYITGNRTATCQIKADEDGNDIGEWNVSITCNALQCEFFPSTPNGEPDGCGSEPFNIGDKCDLQCKDGFYMMGDRRATCQDKEDGDGNDKGEWEVLITCNALQCENFPSAPNGEPDGCGSEPFNIGDKCDLQCKDGFYMTGSRTATCQDKEDGDGNDKGEWDVLITCNALQCKNFPSTPNGEPDGCGSEPFNIGDTCDLQCKDGYYMMGDRTATCRDIEDGDRNDKGEWDILITCNALECNSLPSTVNGEPSGCDSPPFEIGDTCDLQCKEGYYKTGDRRATCEDKEDGDMNNKGEWDASITCNVIICEQEPIIMNGRTRDCNGGEEYQDNCLITCDFGYFVTNGGKVTCRDANKTSDGKSDGIWDYDSNSCESYMVIASPINDTILGVKRYDINLTVEIESVAEDVNVSVRLISSPSRGMMELENLRTTENITTYQVTLFDLTEGDIGEYIIESSATSLNEKKYPPIAKNSTRSVFVNIIPENLKLDPSEMTYIRGSSKKSVICEANGTPDPEFSWHFDDAVGDSFISSGSTLDTGSFYFSDNGTYRCYATNVAAKEYDETPNITILISVEGKPVITGVENTILSPQDDVTLTCSMDAYPNPQKTAWQRNDFNYSINDTFADPSLEVTLADDGSRYYSFENQLILISQLCMGELDITCSATNVHGKSDSNQMFTINSGSYDLNGEFYYTFPGTKMTFAESQQQCNSTNGHLVYILNKETQDYLNGKIEDDFYYIGLIKNGNGNWIWGENGPTLEDTGYSNFNSDADDGIGSCVMSSSEGWIVVSCENSSRHVCQLQVSGIPKDFDLSVDQCNGRFLEVSWKPADKNFAKTIHSIRIKNRNESESTETNQNQDVGMTSFVYQNATPDTQYEIEISAGVDVCETFLPSATKTITTGFDIPKTVIDPTMEMNEVENLCNIEWSYDETFEWQISNYTVIVTTEINVGNGEITEDSHHPTENVLSFEMEPNSKYSAKISAVSCAGEGTAAEISEESTCITGVEVPRSPPSITSTTSPTGEIDPAIGIQITVEPVNQRNGPVSCVFVVATKDDDRATSNNRTVSSTMEKFNSIFNEDDGQYFAYVSSDASKKIDIVLGKGESSECVPVSANSTTRKKRAVVESYKVYNQELESSKYYRYYVLLTTPNGTSFLISTSSLSAVYGIKPYLAWIAGVVVPIVVILVAIAVFIYYRKRKQKKTGDDIPIGEMSNNIYSDDCVYENVEAFELPTMQPLVINARDLENVYRYKHSDDDRIFRQEYKEIKELAKQLDRQFASAKRREIKELNRYGNVVPAHDATVRLSLQKNIPNSDYINASYIDGYQKQNRFIATQGPKPNTIADFWRMVWEKNVPAIVMLTNVDENGKRKCEKYWPDKDESETHGDFNITNVEVNWLGRIVQRKFEITRAGKPNDIRRVSQLHYVSWPDHGVPQTTSDLFNLRRIVRTQYSACKDPIVVHCSAGVGRTGTFIALDNLIEELSQKQCVDIRMQVWNMRLRRTEMVQTTDQYVLLHKMILESYVFKQTDMDVAAVEEKIERIRSPESKEMQKELELIGRVPPLDKSQEVGSSPEHLKMNRDQEAIAYDHNIVAIRARPDERSVPYLNASLIQGYEHDEIYICTQDPISGSEEAFWRMVLDNGVRCIVMITHNQNQEPCARYWPDDQTAIQFDKITVALQENFPEVNLTQRNLFVKEVVLNSTRSSAVTLFEFNAWPENASDPNEVNVVLDLITRVQREKQANEGKDRPVIVHCGNGSYRTSTFCAITAILERLRVESRVDVIRAVKDLRDMRPAMLVDQDEYRLCYDAIQAYLSSFDLYANFR